MDISRPCQPEKWIHLLPWPGFDPSFSGHNDRRQSSASGHDYASDRSAIGDGVSSEGCMRDVDYFGFLQETLYLGKDRDQPLYYILKSIRRHSTKSSFAIKASKGMHVHTWDLVLEIVVLPNIRQKLIKLIYHQFSSIKAYIETCPHDNWSNYNIGILLE